MEITLIVAMTRSRVIGKDNGMPWKLPADLEYFKRVTMGHALIMGRKTHESIGRALPGRRNIVLSRSPDYHAEGCESATSLEAALAICENEEKVFIIGGEQVFKEGLAYADTLRLTILEQDFAGDTYFPEFDAERFPVVYTTRVTAPLPYRIQVHKKRKSE
ncbi:MAG: dihydrofolate reductase [Desulfobulbus propionicus]|nr:MAG: dihydrofolate reductase [Desulfobulbus propionicus]